MKRMILKYALFTGFLVGILFFGFISSTEAQYYNYNNPYQYQGNYSNYVNNNSQYSNYSNSNIDYSFIPYNYGQDCPEGFTLGIQSNTYICFKFLNQYVNNNPLPSQIPGCYTGYMYSMLTGQRCDGAYNNPLPGQIPGCYAGYMYSMLTGQRCDGYYNNYYNTGNITNFNVRSGYDTYLKEGDSSKEIMRIRFNANNGDLRLDRIRFDFEFRGNNNTENLPWNVFDRVKLLSNGREIERINTDSRSSWDIENNNRYSLNFTNLNEIIRNNDRANLSLEVDIDSSISRINNGNILWDVYIPYYGLRAYNQSGDTVYTENNSNSIFLDIRGR